MPTKPPNINPVFNDLSPTSKGITMGNSRIVMWAKGSGGWGGEVACYTGGVNQQIQIQLAGQAMVGSFVSPDGTFTWEMKPDPSGKTFWQMTAGPSGPPQLEQQGLF